jgi:hypothetical protein
MKKVYNPECLTNVNKTKLPPRIKTYDITDFFRNRGISILDYYALSINNQATTHKYN